MSDQKEAALNLNDLDVRPKDLDGAASNELTGGAGAVLKKVGPGAPSPIEGPGKGG